MLQIKTLCKLSAKILHFLRIPIATAIRVHANRILGGSERREWQYQVKKVCFGGGNGTA